MLQILDIAGYTSSSTEVIENVNLFSISNYFLRFSNEYKRIKNANDFDNNWYEYVEYGTTNSLTILLQRNGFSREAATFIRDNQETYVVMNTETGEFRLKTSLLECGNANVRTECEFIQYNAPNLFVESQNT